MPARSRRQREARRFGLYALADLDAAIGAPWAAAWRPHRRNVNFILRSIRAAYRLRNDPHVGEFARAALKAQFAALATFDPMAPDAGAGAFPPALNKFRGDWNALVAARAHNQPRRAAELKRLTGDATRNDVATAWRADEENGGHEYGRIARVAASLGRKYQTVADAARKLGLTAPRDLRKR